jgi:RNA polymerase sigma-32 factor
MSQAGVRVFDYTNRNYLARVRRAPTLSAEEEQELARRYRVNDDIRAADRLVTSHLRLVAKVARNYRGYGVPLDELIGAGNLGLVQAVRRFDPDRGFRFATYAMWPIRAAILDHVLHSVSLVKLATTAAQKRLFFGLRRAKSQLGLAEQSELAVEHVEMIARALDVSHQEVRYMNRRLGAPDQSLNIAPHDGAEDEWQNWLIDESSDQETAYAEREVLSTRVALLRNAIHVLNARELQIVTERWCRERRTTLDVLAQRIGISRERVRQIEVRALDKLRTAMNVPTAAPQPRLCPIA